MIHMLKCPFRTRIVLVTFIKSYKFFCQTNTKINYKLLLLNTFSLSQKKNSCVKIM